MGEDDAVRRVEPPVRVGGYCGFRRGEAYAAAGDAEPCDALGYGGPGVGGGGGGGGGRGRCAGELGVVALYDGGGVDCDERKRRRRAKRGTRNGRVLAAATVRTEVSATKIDIQ